MIKVIGLMINKENILDININLELLLSDKI